MKTIKKLFSLFFIWLFSIPILAAQFTAQDSARIMHYRQMLNKHYDDYPSAAGYIDSTRHFAFQKKWWDQYLYTFYFQSQLAMYHLRFDDLKACQQEADEAIQIYLPLATVQKQPIIESMHFSNWAEYYNRLGLYQKAIDLHQKALQVFKGQEDLSMKDYISLRSTHLNIGTSYRQLGRYEEALKHYLTAEGFGLILENRFDKHGKLGLAKKHLADLHKLRKNYQLAEDYYLAGLEINLSEYLDPSKNYSYATNRLISNLTALADLYNELGHKDKAIAQLQTAEKYSTKASSFIYRIYDRYGEIYISINNPKRALDYFEKGRAIKIDALGKNHPRIATSHLLVASTYLKNNQIDSAINNCEQALFCLTENKSPIITEVYISNEIVPHKENLLKALILKAEILYQKYLNEKNPTDLSEAMTNIDLCEKLFMEMRKEFLTGPDKTYLIDRNYSFFDVALNIYANEYQSTGEKDYLEKCFEIIEKSKGIQLYESIQQESALLSTGIPSEELEKERQLKFELEHWNKKYTEGKEKNIQDSLLNKYYANIIDSKDKLKKLIKIFEEKYTEYHNLKYDLHSIPLKELGIQLTDDQCLVNYYLTDSILYTFYTNSNIENAQLSITKLDENFSHTTASFKNDIRAKRGIEYVEKARLLYNILLSDPLADNLTNDLIISPHTQLWNIPFDALITQDVEKINYKRLPYLINDQKISFTFSATLLNKMHERTEDRRSHEVIAFAPSYKEISPLFATIDLEGRKNFGQLTHAPEEVQEIHNITGGKMVLGALATVKKFLDIWDEASIIHIASHAQANHREPNLSSIVLSNKIDTTTNPYKLYASQLYNTYIPHEMIVLSGCETGVGQIWKGEGMISLARAFAFTGARSIVSTLWNANDESSKKIMVSFYEYLNQGLAKHKALQLAKKDYIQNEKDSNARKHPYYWAAFTPIGNMDPVQFNTELQFSSISLLFGLILFIAICILSFNFFRKRI